MVTKRLRSLNRFLTMIVGSSGSAKLRACQRPRPLAKASPRQ